MVKFEVLNKNVRKSSSHGYGEYIVPIKIIFEGERVPSVDIFEDEFSSLEREDDAYQRVDFLVEEDLEEEDFNLDRKFKNIVEVYFQEEDFENLKEIIYKILQSLKKTLEIIGEREKKHIKDKEEKKKKSEDILNKVKEMDFNNLEQ